MKNTAPICENALLLKKIAPVMESLPAEEVYQAVLDVYSNISQSLELVPPSYNSAPVFRTAQSFVEKLQGLPDDRSIKKIKETLKKIGYIESSAEEMTLKLAQDIDPEELNYLLKGLLYSESHDWRPHNLDFLISVCEEKEIPITEAFRLMLNSRPDSPDNFTDLVVENHDRFNIHHFGRYTIKMMEDNLKADERENLAVAIYADHDHNGALYDDVAFLKQIKQHDYKLLIYEAGNKEEFLSAITESRRKFGKIDLVFINAHGGVDGMTLKDSHKGYIETADFKGLNKEELLALKRSFTVDARVILSSCSTGEGGPLSDNFAGAMQGAFGIKYLYACKTLCSADSLLWDGKGRIAQVRWNEDKSTHTNTAFSRYDDIIFNMDEDLKKWIAQNIIKAKDISSNDNYDVVAERIFFVKDVLPSISDFQGIVKTSVNKSRELKNIQKMIDSGNTATTVEHAYFGNYGVKNLIADIQTASGCKTVDDNPLSDTNMQDMVGTLRVLHHRNKYKASNVKRVSYDQGYGKINDDESKYANVKWGFIDENFENLLKQIHPDKRREIKSKIIELAGECNGPDEAESFFNSAVNEYPGEYAFISVFDGMAREQKLETAKKIFMAVDKKLSKEKIEKNILKGLFARDGVK